MASNIGIAMEQSVPPSVGATAMTSVDSGSNISTATSSNLPMRKRNLDNVMLEGASVGNAEKKVKVEISNSTMGTTNPMTPGNTKDTIKSELKPLNRPPMSKAREVRLEQNRKAARESRRRKKVMVEELQRSVIFFTRANSTLKSQNEELERLLLHAQSQVQAFEKDQKPQAPVASNVATASNVTDNSPPSQVIAPAPTQGPTTSDTSEVKDVKQNEIHDAQVQHAVATAQAQQVQNLTTLAQQTQAHRAAQAAATQAMFESQGFPPAAARAAAQTFVAAPKDTNQTSAVPSNGTNASNEVSQTTTTANTQGPTLITTNPWPFLVTLTPGGQIQFPNNMQQVLVAGAPAPQGSTTAGKAPEMNQYYALQMHPYVTNMPGNNTNGTIAGLNPMIMQLPTFNNNNDGSNNVVTVNAPTNAAAPTGVITAVSQNNLGATPLNENIEQGQN